MKKCAVNSFTVTKTSKILKKNILVRSLALVMYFRSKIVLNVTGYT